MRTNVEIDDELMARAMRSTGLSTRAAVIDAALRWLVDPNADEPHSTGRAARVILDREIERRDTELIRASGRHAELDVFAAHLGFAPME